MAKIDQINAKMNHRIINNFANRNVVNRPFKCMIPLLSSNLPIKIGLKLFPKNGITLWRTTFEALTLPTAFCFIIELNTVLFVAFFNLSTDAERAYLLSNEQGTFPKMNLSSLLIMAHNFIQWKSLFLQKRPSLYKNVTCHGYNAVARTIS